MSSTLESSPAHAQADAPAALTLAVRYSIGFFLLAALHGIVLRTRLDPERISETANPFLLFAAQDHIFAPTFVGLLSILMFLPNGRPFVNNGSAGYSVRLTRWTVPLTCLMAFLLSWVAATFIHHSFDLSLDEFTSSFQARIFLEGKLLADLPPADFANSNFLQPFFVYRDEHHYLRASHYRPVFAAFRALFPAMMPTAFMNARIAGLPLDWAWGIQTIMSAAALAAVAWTFWRRRDPVLSTVLFLTASFLFTPYAFNYDMVVFGWLLMQLRDHERNQPIDDRLAMVVWTLPITTMILGLAHIPCAGGVRRTADLAPAGRDPSDSPL